MLPSHVSKLTITLKINRHLISTYIALTKIANNLLKMNFMYWRFSCDSIVRHVWYSNEVFIVVFWLYHQWNSIIFMTFYAVNRQTIHFNDFKNFDTILKRYTGAWLFSTTFTNCELHLIKRIYKYSTVSYNVFLIYHKSHTIKPYRF